VVDGKRMSRRMTLDDSLMEEVRSRLWEKGERQGVVSFAVVALDRSKA